ncbi:hydroxysteroid dehydrogenase-like protein 2 [Tetranychus urticae]|uniref:Hydroxysteroid dehydrogenase-like protein 2 n=1 Tax=Tetranychus urticae TaxID=32264 RepID=T1K1B0_TETUR|nr:hydroxysteroid dehydrogenase-like protein 2 [Tetranychus urticae]
MINTGALAGRTVFITGASRGIGKAIALKLAKDGCNVAIAAKTVDPHPKLPGTIYTAAKEVEEAGGKCLPLQVDIRYEDQVKDAIEKTVAKFGGLDIVINNASAINLTSTEAVDMKRYDLMHNINTRGTFVTSKSAIPFLKKSDHAHILNLSPPLVMNSRWFKPHVAYTMAKYGMSMCVLGMSEEFRDDKIAVNALWPKTAVWTAAMNVITDGPEIRKVCRKPEILADAAYAILSKSPEKFTGNFCVDETLLKQEGITDFDQYAEVKGEKLMLDFFLPDEYYVGEELPEKFGDVKDAKDGSKVDRVFKGIKGLLDDNLKKQINALLLFQVSGKNWIVDAHESRPITVSQNENPVDNPDVTLITDEETFYKMAKGEVKATNAFMSGKLKIKGNIAVAMQLEKLFGKIKAKL